MKDFSGLGVPDALVECLAAEGVTEPFPVQTMVVPDALVGADLAVRAPTGSGKTLAFGIAVVARVGQAAPHCPRALVLAPTRELAQQISDALHPMARAYDRRVAAFFGGTGYSAQARALRNGLDIAVACPGRLEDLIESGTISLGDVDIVVVDEADRLADMGFLPSVQRILDQVRSDRQTMLFSATLDGDVDTLVRDYQQNPLRHELRTDADDSGTVRHLFVEVAPTQRLRVAAKLVASHGPTIVFCRTRHGTDRVARQLSAEGIRAVAIHGDRSQRERESALAAFVGNRADALVATDVAARGIHVDDVACVIHYDPPADSKDYVHRSGRTGRAGRDGVVVTLVVPDKATAVAALRAELGIDDGDSDMREALGDRGDTHGESRRDPPPRRGVGTVGSVPIHAAWLPYELTAPLRRPRNDGRGERAERAGSGRPDLERGRSDLERKSARYRLMAVDQVG